MAAPTRIFSLNLGMQSVLLAEFRTTPSGGITLHACKQEELIVDPASDATRPQQIENAVTNLRKALAVPNREPVHFCLPSQAVFARFVKLPGSTPEEVASIIPFEAQQNVPFPIDEVVWDYQIMGTAKDNNWDIALVAIKADLLSDSNIAVNNAGFKTATIDVAPMALYNAFRYNYSDLGGCSLLIDIGARTTNLIFIEGQRVFSRSIPVGGSTISQAIAKEFKQDITVGERLKIEKGFVGLGGAYAEPEDPTEMKISKIVRNTLTRLHAEIARSMSFYRQNQSGSAPVRAFLCGGTVSLPYMLEFFSEKLQMPIEFFNPLRNVTVSGQEAALFASGKAHVLGEVVGGALRALDNCPMEINLRPPSVVREQDIAKRKPFLLLAAACLLLAVGAWTFYFYRATGITQEKRDAVTAEVNTLQAVASKFDALEKEKKSLEQTAGPLALMATERAAWGEIIDDLATRLPSHFIWITELIPLSGGKPVLSLGNQSSSVTQTVSGGGQSKGGANTPAPGAPKIDAIQVSGLYLFDSNNPEPQRVVDAFYEQLQKSSIFNLEGKDKVQVLVQRMTPDGTKWAYEYTLVLPLKNPISIP